MSTAMRKPAYAYNNSVEGSVRGSQIYVLSHWSMKSRSMSTGHNACSKNMARTISMQGLAITATIAEEKFTFSHWFMSVTKVGKVGQGHFVWVTMHAPRVCSGQFSNHSYLCRGDTLKCALLHKKSCHTLLTAMFFNGQITMY